MHYIHICYRNVKHKFEASAVHMLTNSYHTGKIEKLKKYFKFLA